MTMTHDIEPGRRVDLDCEVIGLGRSDWQAGLVGQVAGRPPQRIDGFTIGSSTITGEVFHGGEMHPDGDEVLYLISGSVTVTLELEDGDCLVDLEAEDAVVVPKGVWHQITMRKQGQLINITPGPHGEARPLRTAPADTATGRNDKNHQR